MNINMLRGQHYLQWHEHSDSEYIEITARKMKYIELQARQMSYENFNQKDLSVSAYGRVMPYLKAQRISNCVYNSSGDVKGKNLIAKKAKLG